MSLQEAMTGQEKVRGMLKSIYQKHPLSPLKQHIFNESLPQVKNKTKISMIFGL